MAIDELQIPWALRITVAGTILGTSLVAIVLGETTVCIHGAKVQGTIQTTRQLRDVDVEGELGVG